MEERQYLVSYNIQVMAEDEVDAARQVKGILQDPDNQAWNFAVTDEDNPMVYRMVDVEEYMGEPPTVRGPFNSKTGEEV